LSLDKKASAKKTKGEDRGGEKGNCQVIRRGSLCGGTNYLIKRKAGGTKGRGKAFSHKGRKGGDFFPGKGGDRLSRMTISEEGEGGKDLKIKDVATNREGRNIYRGGNFIKEKKNENTKKFHWDPEGKL